GLVTLLFLVGVMKSLRIRPVVMIAVSLFLIFAQAFLNFAQTGSSYIPALAMLAASMYFAARPEGRAKSGLLSGTALGLSICLWFPFVLVIPAVLATPYLVRRHNGSASDGIVSIDTSSSR